MESSKEVLAVMSYASWQQSQTDLHAFNSEIRKCWKLSNEERKS